MPRGLQALAVWFLICIKKPKWSFTAVSRRLDLCFSDLWRNLHHLYEPQRNVTMFTASLIKRHFLECLKPGFTSVWLFIWGFLKKEDCHTGVYSIHLWSLIRSEVMKCNDMSDLWIEWEQHCNKCLHPIRVWWGKGLIWLRGGGRYQSKWKWFCLVERHRM